MDWSRLKHNKKETLKLIKEEYDTWFEKQYGKVSVEERKKLGAVFTPPEITIELLEQFDDLDSDILDPCCGAGNLLAACIIAGADPNKVYGNEFESTFVEVARKRLAKLGMRQPKIHIHQGDATIPYCLSEFSRNYQYPLVEEQQQNKLVKGCNLDTDGANEEYEKMMSLMKSSD